MSLMVHGRPCWLGSNNGVPERPPCHPPELHIDCSQDARWVAHHKIKIQLANIYKSDLSLVMPLKISKGPQFQRHMFIKGGGYLWGSKLTQPEKYTQCHKITDHNKQDIKRYAYMLTLSKNREEMYLQANSRQDHKRGCLLNQENLKGWGWGRDKGIEWPFCGALSGHSTVSVNCELHLKWQQLDRVSGQDKWCLGKFSHKKKKRYLRAGAQGWVYLGQKGKDHWDTGLGRMTCMGKAGSALLDVGLEKRGGMRIMTHHVCRAKELCLYPQGPRTFPKKSQQRPLLKAIRCLLTTGHWFPGISFVAPTAIPEFSICTITGLQSWSLVRSRHINNSFFQGQIPKSGLQQRVLWLVQSDLNSSWLRYWHMYLLHHHSSSLQNRDYWYKLSLRNMLYWWWTYGSVIYPKSCSNNGPEEEHHQSHARDLWVWPVS